MHGTTEQELKLFCVGIDSALCAHDTQILEKVKFYTVRLSWAAGATFVPKDDKSEQPLGKDNPPISDLSKQFKYFWYAFQQ